MARPFQKTLKADAGEQLENEDQPAIKAKYKPDESGNYKYLQLSKTTPRAEIEDVDAPDEVDAVPIDHSLRNQETRISRNWGGLYGTLKTNSDDNVGRAGRGVEVPSMKVEGGKSVNVVRHGRVASETLKKAELEKWLNLPISSSSAQTWAHGIHSGDVWDGREWRHMDRRIASDPWTRSYKNWDIENDHVPEAWEDGAQFSFRQGNVNTQIHSFEKDEVCIVIDSKTKTPRFARIISSTSKGGTLRSDIALDNRSKNCISDVPNKQIAKLREDVQNGLPFWLNESQDLATWKKPPDVRDFLYADAKLEFDGGHWHKALPIFQNILVEGHGDDFHHTKKYIDVCIKHIKHRQDITDATEVYNDAKHLYAMGKYAEAQTAFNFVVEIKNLGTKRDFHHTRDYLLKCKHKLNKTGAGDEEEKSVQMCEQGNQAATRKLTHYYSQRMKLGASETAFKRQVSKGAGSKPYEVLQVPKDWWTGQPLPQEDIVAQIGSTRSIVGGRYAAENAIKEEEDVKSDCSIS